MIFAISFEVTMRSPITNLTRIMFCLLLLLGLTSKVDCVFPKVHYADCKTAVTIPKLLLGGFNFTIRGLDKCQPPVDVTKLTVGYENPVVPLPCSAEGKGTAKCHMPLGMPWGRAVIRHAGRNATFVAVLSPPSFTLDPSAEDPVRTFKIFPTLEPDWLTAGYPKQMKIWVYEKECKVSSITTSSIVCKSDGFSDVESRFGPAFAALIVLWAIAFIILLILALILLNNLYKTKDKLKSDVIEDIPPPDEREVPEMILEYREYCSSILFNSPQIHPYFTFDVVEEPLTKEQNVAKSLITEEIFINAVRELLDHSKFEQEIVREVACIVVLSNRMELVDFAAILRRMLKDQIYNWQRTQRGELDQDQKHQAPFVIYLCAAWYVVTSYEEFKNSDALKALYQLFWDTDGVVHQGWVDENSGLSEFAVARSRVQYTTQEIHAEKSKLKNAAFRVRSSDTTEIVRLKLQDHENADIGASKRKPAHKLKTMVKNPPSEDVELEDQVISKVGLVNRYRFATSASAYLKGGKAKDIDKKKLKDLTKMHLSESWTLFAAMNEFDDCTGREMDHFNRPKNDQAAPTKIEFLEDDSICRQCRKTIGKDVRELLKGIVRETAPQKLFLCQAIDTFCDEAGAPEHVRNFFKDQIFLKEFWSVILKDVDKCLDVDCSNVTRKNMTCIGTMFEFPPKATGEHMQHLLGLRNKIRVYDPDGDPGFDDVEYEEEEEPKEGEGAEGKKEKEEDGEKGKEDGGLDAEHEGTKESLIDVAPAGSSRAGSTMMSEDAPDVAIESVRPSVDEEGDESQAEGSFDEGVPENDDEVDEGSIAPRRESNLVDNDEQRKKSSREPSQDAGDPDEEADPGEAEDPDKKDSNDEEANPDEDPNRGSEAEEESVYEDPMDEPMEEPLDDEQPEAMGESGVSEEPGGEEDDRGDSKVEGEEPEAYEDAEEPGADLVADENQPAETGLDDAERHGIIQAVDEGQDEDEQGGSEVEGAEDGKKESRVSEEQSTEGTVSEKEDKGNTEGAPARLSEGRDTQDEDTADEADPEDDRGTQDEPATADQDENRGTSAALGEAEGSESAAGASAPKTFTSGDSGGLQGPEIIEEEAEPGAQDEDDEDDDAIDERMGAKKGKENYMSQDMDGDKMEFLGADKPKRRGSKKEKSERSSEVSSTASDWEAGSDDGGSEYTYDDDGSSIGSEYTSDDDAGSYYSYDDNSDMISSVGSVTSDQISQVSDVSSVSSLSGVSQMDNEEIEEKREMKRMEKLRAKKEAKKAALKEELKRKKKRRRRKKKKRRRRRRRRRRKTMKDKEDIEWLNEENTWIPHKVNQRRLMEDLLIFLHKFEIELENIFEERDRTREEDHIYKKIKHIFKTAEKEYDLESIYDMDKSPYLRWNPPLWSGPEIDRDDQDLQPTERPPVSLKDGNVLDEDEPQPGKDPVEDRKDSQWQDIGNEDPHDRGQEGELWRNFYGGRKDGGKNSELREGEGKEGEDIRKSTLDADDGKDEMKKSFEIGNTDQAAGGAPKSSQDEGKETDVGRSLDIDKDKHVDGSLDDAERQELIEGDEASPDKQDTDAKSLAGPDIKFSESNVPKDEEAEGEDKQIFEQPRDSETRSGSVFNESDNEDPADAGPKSKPKIDQLDDDGMNEMVMDFGGEDYPPKEQPPRKASNNSNESKDG